MSKGVSRVWDQSPVLAVVLSGGSLIFAIVATWHHFLPGVCIGVLGGLAALVSLRPQMHVAEKAVWCVVFGLVLYSEIRNIRADREQSDADQKIVRAEENRRFEGVASDLKNALRISQEQYSSTLSHVDAVSTQTSNVLGATQKVAETARENLLNVTGGDSYAYVWPAVVLRNPTATLNIHNFGEQPLSITVTIYDVTQYSSPAFKSQSGTTSGAISIGTVAPHEGRVIPPPGGLLDPRLGSDGMAHYLIFINQQNAGVRETLDFRLSQNGNGLAYRLEAFRPLLRTHGRGDVLRGQEWVRPLAKTEWIEPEVTSKRPWKDVSEP